MSDDTGMLGRDVSVVAYSQTSAVSLKFVEMDRLHFTFEKIRNKQRGACPAEPIRQTLRCYCDCGYCWMNDEGTRLNVGRQATI